MWKWWNCLIWGLGLSLAKYSSDLLGWFFFCRKISARKFCGNFPTALEEPLSKGEPLQPQV